MSVSGEKRALWGLTDIVVIALALVPVVWIVSLSLKTPATLTDGAFFPQHPSFSNYRGIFHTTLFTRSFVNSIGIHLSNEGVWIGSKVLIGDFGELESVDCGPFNL